MRAPSYGDIHDAAVIVDRGAPFLGRTGRALCGVVCMPLVCMEGILGEVVVGHAYVRIRKQVAGDIERRMVVAGGEIGIDDDAHVVLILEIEEILLHVSDDDGHVVDAGIVQLADLTFDQNLAMNLEHALRLLVGNGRESRGKPCGQNDGVVHLVRRERIEAGLRAMACRIDQPVRYEHIERPAIQDHGVACGGKPESHPRRNRIDGGGAHNPEFDFRKHVCISLHRHLCR